MKLTWIASVAGVLLSLTGATHAQSSSAASAGTESAGSVRVENGVPLSHLMATVAKNVPAAQLVPLLRPIIPQAGHLVALPCVNKLFIVDTFGNVQRIQAIVDALDVGEAYKPEKCELHEFSSGRSDGEHK